MSTDQHSGRAEAERLYDQVMISSEQAVAAMSSRLQQYHSHPQRWGRMLAELQVISEQFTAHLADCASLFADCASQPDPAEPGPPTVYGIDPDLHDRYWAAAQARVENTEPGPADYAAVFTEEHPLPDGAAMHGEHPRTDDGGGAQDPVVLVLHRDTEPGTVLALHCGGMLTEHIEAELEARGITETGPPNALRPQNPDGTFFSFADAGADALFDVYGRRVVPDRQPE